MEQEEIILGIDPGFGRCGFAVIRRNGGEVRCITHGVIETHSGGEFSERLVEIGDDLLSLLKKYEPSRLVMEQLFFAKSTTTALQVAEVRGLITYLCAKQGILVEAVLPNEVKLALTGYGRADKKQMQEMIKMTFKLEAVPKPDDAADALAIAYTGALKARYAR